MIQSLGNAAQIIQRRHAMRPSLASQGCERRNANEHVSASNPVRTPATKNTPYRVCASCLSGIARSSSQHSVVNAMK